MLIKIDDERAIFACRMATDPGGFRVVDRQSRERRLDLGGQAALKASPDGRLLLRHENGVALVDPAEGFSRVELGEVQLEGPAAAWDAAFLGAVVDCSSRIFAKFEVPVDALGLEDPGYSGPIDAILLPGGRRVAVLIARSPHVAIYDLKDGTTQLVLLGGGYGMNNALLRGRSLWLANYDRLCSIDVDTLEMRSSAPLQPQYRDPKYGVMTSAFIGVPRFSDRHGVFLVPRPYCGDVLAVPEETLEPAGRLVCGGRPYDLVEFADGDLLILDHPMDTVRSLSTPTFEPLQAQA